MRAFIECYMSAVDDRADDFYARNNLGGNDRIASVACTRLDRSNLVGQRSSLQKASRYRIAETTYKQSQSRRAYKGMLASQPRLYAGPSMTSTMG